ncbi:hypothetical protein GGX14DRAFT_458431 [Mycena pura]|uniref:F-box domain-containing protein n=1 Tax=Mycena pura TaxID=153505 RepID=A0AAD6V8F1_9AGAR|nr:hypothetical protein GGX14DRAFT_458431 [Mycena pura]
MDTVPNELWLEIFEHLPRKSLSQASLTAHSFWRLARPFLFRHFHFHPYAYYDGSFYLPSPERMARAKERLHFWLSDEIAPFVHECRISSWSERHCQDSTDSPNILLDILLLQLPRFTNLWHLTANCATFTGAAMSTLRGMSTLRHLEIERCWVDAEESLESFSPALTLFSFSGRYRCPLTPWIPFLRPDSDHLRELRLLCELRDWNEHLEAIPVYPHVRRLQLNWSNTGTNDCLAVLSRFPNIRVAGILDFVGHDRRFNSLASITFPFLKVLTVSCNCLPVILPRAPLGKLTVGDGTAKELISRLEELDKSATVAIYSLRLDSIPLDPDGEGLKKILQYFPHLVRLRVEANFSNHDTATMLLTVFPWVSFSQSTLESVSISLSAVQSQKSVAVRRALMEKCPGVTSLRLEGADFELRWRMHGDGIVEEDYVPVQNEDDNLSPEAEELLSCLRKDFNIWWNAGDNASNLRGPSTVM